MDNNYLKHYGVLGMKWGVRRYRNKDGTLTPAGKKRYYKEADAAGYHKEGASGRRYRITKEGKAEGFDADPNKWFEDDLTRKRRVADEGTQLASRLKTANEKAMRKQPKKQMDLSNMTDREMREQINRALLEKQYNDMFAPQTTNRGREYVAEIIDTAGDVLGVTASALGLALAIQQLRKLG